MARNHQGNPWCRYADDGLMHCKTLEQAQDLLRLLEVRFNDCGLELHPEKTKIVYCKDDNRRGKHSTTSFDFLGYTFLSPFIKKSARRIILQLQSSSKQESIEVDA